MLSKNEILTIEFEILGEYDFTLLSLVGERLKKLGHKINYYLTSEEELGVYYDKKNAENLKNLNIKNLSFERNFSADAYVSLQPPCFSKKYKGRKIKISYASNFIQQHSFASDKSTLKELDGFIAQGHLSAEQAAIALPKNRIRTMDGAMQYDERQNFDKLEFTNRHALDSSKKNVLYLPTWDEHSSIDMFFEPLKVLGEKYNLLIRAHDSIYVLASTTNGGWYERENPDLKQKYRFNLKERIDKLQKMSKINARMNTLLQEYVANADMIIVDAKSGVLAEVLLCSKEIPIIALTPLIDSEIASRYDKRIYKMAPLLNKAQDLLPTVDSLFNCDTYKQGRKDIKYLLYGNAEGYAAIKAVNAIIEFSKMPPFKKMNKIIFKIKSAISKYIFK